MKLPMFTAESSLYATRGVDRFVRPAIATGHANRVTPQLGGKGFKGFHGCIDDCMDSHPNWNVKQCARACRDPFSGVDLGTESNGFNDFLSGAGIDFWEAGCSSLVNPWACRQVANVMRRQS
jgi:hypothetical protein